LPTLEGPLATAPPDPARRRSGITCETKQPKHDVPAWKPDVLDLQHHVLSLIHNMMFSVGHVMFRIEFYQVFTDVLLRQNMMCHLTNMCCYMWSYHTFSELDRTIPQADCGQFPSYSQTWSGFDIARQDPLSATSSATALA
jgi:hypothetical protein